MNIIQFIKKRGGLIIKLSLCLVLAVMLSIGSISIVKSDAKRKREMVNSSGEDFYMELEEKEYGESVFETAAKGNVYTLLVNKATGETAVRLNATGDTWFSNPQDRESDTVAVIKTRLSSQLCVKYMDIETGNLQTVDNFLGSIRKNGMSWSKIENGIRFEFTFPVQGFVVPIEYTLQNDIFKATIPTNEIKELNKKQYLISAVDVLPFFAAAGLKDQGYIFIPDGSGALINYNNGKKCEPYCENVYGTDLLLSDITKNSNEHTIQMPVFGLKTNHTAVFGIITSGDASACISATSGGNNTSYNQAYSGFNYRDTFTTRISKDNKEYNFTQYGECCLNGTNFSIEYRFLHGENANYSGMAACYRSYLMEQGVLKDKMHNAVPMAVELYGAIITQKNVLGVQKDTVTKLTSYEQVQQMAEDFKADNVKNFAIQYRGWNSGGLKAKMTDTVKAEKELGGSRALNNLISYTEKNDIPVYFEADFMNLYQDGNGYHHARNGTKLLMQEPAKVYSYEYASGKIITDTLSYLLYPNGLKSLCANFSKSAQKNHITSVFATGFGNMLYADYSKTNYTMRYASKQKVEEALSVLDSAGQNVAVQGANIYAISAASTIFDVPTESSKFDVSDRSVPFYQMVIRGYKNMFVESLNLSSNPKRDFLKAIETGSGIKFTWIAEDTSILYETEYNHLFGLNRSAWYDQSVKQYAEVEALYARIGDSCIISHTAYAENVFVTEYENGTRVAVNYSGRDVLVDGIKVPADNYSILS